MADVPVDAHRFEFDLDRGIRTQAVEKLESSPELPLAKGIGPQASGIYALYFKGQLVYIGKASKGTTKAKRTLRARLNEHVGKIAARRNIIISDMTCRYHLFERMVGLCSRIRTYQSLQSSMEREWIRQQNTGKRPTRH